MSPDGQEPIEQAGPDDGDSEIPGLVLLVLFVVISALGAGFVYFSNFLNWLLGMTEDFPLFYVALGILVVLAKIAAAAIATRIPR